MNADLVVMGSHRKQLLDVIVGTTLERVLRKGSYPVLMVNNEAQRKYETVLAPVDMVEASIRAVEVAAKLGLIGDRPPTLLHAFTPIAKGKLSLSGADQASIASYVANERQEVLNEMVGFFSDTLARLPGRPSLRVDEGEAMELISRAVSEMRPDLLVMGTNGRSALVSILIGSVTEAALRTLDGYFSRASDDQMSFHLAH